MIKKLFKLMARLKPAKKTKHSPTQAWEKYCYDNPDAPECRIYEI